MKNGQVLSVARKIIEFLRKRYISVVAVRTPHDLDLGLTIDWNLESGSQTARHTIKIIFNIYNFCLY